MRISIGNKKIFSKCLNELLNTRIKDTALNGITFDSREMQSGDIFIAFSGLANNGHDYIDECINKGAVLVINELFQRNKTIKVNSSKNILGELAKRYRSKMSCKVIAITGSNGKTTTKELLVHILNTKYLTSYTEGNYNSTIGMPMSIFSINKSDQIFVAEIGTSEKGEIEFLSDIAMPDLAIITNIGESHLLNFEDLSGVYKEKINLFKSLTKSGKAFINMDDNTIRSESSNMGVIGELVFYGSNKAINKQLDYFAKEDLDNSNKIHINKNSIEIPKGKNIHRSNIIAAFSICDELKISIREFNSKLSTFKIPNGRGNIVKNKNFTIINDSYNSNFSSIVSGLKMVEELYSSKRIIIVLGDMLELGENEKEIHRSLHKHISNKCFHAVFIYGALMYELFLQSRSLENNLKIHYYKDQNNLISDLKDTIKANDIIYVKGSRGMKMENVIEGIA